ncbi:hypothetical protein I3J09_13875 [Streptomyces clavuligerus]|uniref:Uncharacterized protein n=6 Tax=Streptomyces clavuligerus TaxID=1901 RepID=E2PWP2_STRCL|nr:hypothetical protein BB341_13725 [Streptomyces clavuligerus]AXU13800.1 hypothetical protein D1794_14305 [Streptomyces clavuligerus]EFG08041.1 Hypothetical protein SCLAV_2970 [Streptomyces clavuligerus]MBY6303766.1 hypothetical protein [Streptomyces clavuligerus]QCS06575.1 hypothetical protein CRV15_13655 [Streptomyces clavuligerus]
MSSYDDGSAEQAAAPGPVPGTASGQGRPRPVGPRRPPWPEVRTDTGPLSAPWIGPPRPNGPPTAGPVPPAPDGAAPPGGTAPGPAGGILALAPPYRAAAALALVLVTAVAAGHIGMVFLHVAPPNTATRQYGDAIDAWIYPEFEQNWKLFAPNPLQQNIAVEVRAEVRTPEGERRTTGWVGLTAEDTRAIRGNPLPSHVHQNELRRAWDFYVNSHDGKGRATGERGRLSERYIRRIALLRLQRYELGGPVTYMQLRSTTRPVEAPPWSGEKTDTRPVHRLLPWWTVTEADRPEAAG